MAKRIVAVINRGERVFTDQETLEVIKLIVEDAIRDYGGRVPDRLVIDFVME